LSTPDTAGLRIRSAVRAILLTPDSSLLLVRFEFPGGTVWALPGGGVDPGESYLEALHRELDEEVGIVAADVGPHVWTRLYVGPFADDAWDGQEDRYHLVLVPDRFEPTPAMSWEELRAERLHELRWWHLDEITAATDITFAPSRLGELLGSLASDGVPAAPIETGA
jgi:8-oxo-dGTP pyrophosphatase MutT (NUDIX family)